VERSRRRQVTSSRRATARSGVRIRAPPYTSSRVQRCFRPGGRAPGSRTLRSSPAEYKKEGVRTARATKCMAVLQLVSSIAVALRDEVLAGGETAPRIRFLQSTKNPAASSRVTALATAWYGVGESRRKASRSFNVSIGKLITSSKTPDSTLTADENRITLCTKHPPSNNLL